MISVAFAGVLAVPVPAAAGTVKHSTPRAHPSSRASGARLSHAGGLRQGATLALGSGFAKPGGSARVRTLQRALTRAGSAAGPIDGLYGPLTERAVRAYQAAHGLSADGIAGPRTWAAIGARTQLMAEGAGYHQPGGSGRVRGLQRSLARAGDRPGPIDGRYGPLTSRAVRRFQAAHGLPADGIAGPRTTSRLGRGVRAQHPARTRPASNTNHQRPIHTPQPAPRPATPQPAAPTVPQGASQPASPVNHLHGAGTQPPARKGHPGGSPLTPWLLVPIALLALALLLGGGRYARTRERSRRRARPPLVASDAGVLAAAPQKADSEVTPAREAHPAPNGGGAVTEVGHRRADERGDAAGAFNLGVLLEGRGDLDGAQAAYARADQRGHAAAAFNLGVLLEAREDMAGAQQAYSRADQRGHAAAASNLGVLLEEQRDLQGAQHAYSRADQRGDATGAFNLGVLLEGHGDPDRAQAAYARADQRGHAAAASNLGVLLEAQQDLTSAEAAYRRADQRGDATGAFNLGVLLEEQHDPTGAEAAYRRADQRGQQEIAQVARDALNALRDRLTPASGHPHPDQHHAN